VTAPRIPAAGSSELEVEGRRLRLSSLDKVMWPAVGLTKGQMIEYYLRAAPALVPHVAGRAMTLGRFPDGVERPGFAQTECRGRPDWMATHPLRLRSGEIRRYCGIQDAASLAWVANLGAVELHHFLAPADRPQHPGVVAFDLDPGAGAALSDCCRVALWLREALGEVGLDGFAKTSGSRGLHVYVPVDASYPYDRTRAFAREVARRLATDHPQLVTDAASRSSRTGRVLVDWAQNHPRRSMVAAYSLRAADWPTVSTPVGWDEVAAAPDSPDSAALVFLAGGVIDRLNRAGDLFAPMLERRQTLPARLPARQG
jgi:bifunctional non-homologous end joining protein LigD